LIHPATIAGIGLGLYMAWNIGANDVANAMGTSVGSRALKLHQALLVAAFFEFLGAFLVGGHVTQTIRKGIVDPAVFASRPNLLVLAMVSALLAASVWLQVSTYAGWPVSTTHAIVGGVIGVGLVQAGFQGVHFGKVATIVVSWIVSPVVGGISSFLIFWFLRRKILSSEDPAGQARKFAPYLGFPVAFTVVLSIIYKGLKNLHFDLPFWQALAIAFLVGALFSLGTAVVARRSFRGSSGTMELEGFFRVLQVVSACSVAFSHGANDVANAVGPMAAIFAAGGSGDLGAQVEVPYWLLWIGGLGIVVGLWTWGYRVIETVGRKITEMTPSRGFAAEFSTAATVLVCSKMGIPVSTTHVLVGSVIGVGFARGMGALNLGIIGRIFVSWVVTLPVAGVLSAVLYLMLRAVW